MESREEFSSNWAACRQGAGGLTECVALCKGPEDQSKLASLQTVSVCSER